MPRLLRFRNSLRRPSGQVERGVTATLCYESELAVFKGVQTALSAFKPVSTAIITCSHESITGPNPGPDESSRHP
jgi:hypothetical protein